jgi:hypothetical protein
MNHVIKFLAVALAIVIHAQGASAEPAHVSRDRIARQIGKVIVPKWVSPETSTPDREAINTMIGDRISALASEVLPPFVECESEQSADRASSVPFFLEYNDDAYIDLSIRVQLLGTMVSLKYQLMFPFSEEQRRAVAGSLKSALEGIRKSMHDHLIGKYPLYSADEVDQQLDAMESQLSTKIADRDSYWLKLPLKQADADSLVSDFNARLAQSVDRVGRRIDETAAKNADGKISEKESDFLRKTVLDEVTLPAAEIIKEKTTDPERKVDISLKFAPQYHKLQQELNRRRAELSRPVKPRSSDK